VGLPLTSLSHLKAELPRDLALLDVERSLPKLSVLPPTGDKYVVWASAAVGMQADILPATIYSARARPLTLSLTSQSTPQAAKPTS
jgi:hypothetical protein